MLFTSLDYAFFLPVVFLLYWFVFGKNHLYQNVLLLVASYFFYAYWDVRFLGLLFFSTLLDFFSGLQIENAKSDRMRTFWSWISVVINLSFLGFFKYYNFFVGSFADMLTAFGFQPNVWTLRIILPVGISFYTFHGLSYILDIYKRRIKPTKNFVDYAVFVSFFPLLVAGPIERATHLLPQVERPRTFSKSGAIDGLRQILWGLFKKIVIADTCAEYVNVAFNDSIGYSGSTHLIGIIFFAFQIYCDFSGYSDIALGSARLFGIELIRNFDYPFISKSITEYWRRWHISLSSWLNDYVFTPIIVKRRDWGKFAVVYGLFITFFLSGLWHGAGWTFIIWGLLHAAALTYEFLTKKFRKRMSKWIAPGIYNRLSILFMFTFLLFSWVFFRASSVREAFHYIAQIFRKSIFSLPEQLSTVRWEILCALIVFVMTIEWFGRENKYAVETALLKKPAAVRWGFYYLIITMMFIFSGKEQQFIYFQF